MLLEKGEFVKEISTGEIHWIERVERDYVTLAMATYVNKVFSKDYFALTINDFYEQYTDVKGGS